MKVIKEKTMQLPGGYELDIELGRLGTKKKVRVSIWDVHYGPFGIKYARRRVDGWERGRVLSDDPPFEKIVRNNVAKALHKVKEMVDAEKEIEELEVIVQ